MASNTSKCNHLTLLRFKWLTGNDNLLLCIWMCDRQDADILPAPVRTHWIGS